MSRLDASLDIDLASPREIVRIIQAEDARVADAVERSAEEIASAIDAIAHRLRNGGRLFYIGAGTSGRIAMLDAAELTPTFGVEAGLVQVIIAGGTSAMDQAVEGAEDNAEDAVIAVGDLVHPTDCLVGIAASGTTPFTVAAVREANRIGALTVGVTSTPGSSLATDATIAIVTDVGAEVIMESSRMKSGTAQKLVLNTISTGVMILLGHVHSNLMVDMPATNTKLRSRAIRMVELAAGVDRETAEHALGQSSTVREAIVVASKGLSSEEARLLLETHDGNLRKVLGK